MSIFLSWPAGLLPGPEPSVGRGRPTPMRIAAAILAAALALAGCTTDHANHDQRRHPQGATLLPVAPSPFGCARKKMSIGHPLVFIPGGPAHNLRRCR
jgi:hypothetical protein